MPIFLCFILLKTFINAHSKSLERKRRKKENIFAYLYNYYNCWLEWMWKYQEGAKQEIIRKIKLASALVRSITALALAGFNRKRETS